jgi:hypothetical protein
MKKFEIRQNVLFGFFLKGAKIWGVTQPYKHRWDDSIDNDPLDLVLR